MASFHAWWWAWGAGVRGFWSRSRTKFYADRSWWKTFWFFYGSFLFFRIILMKLPTNFSGHKTLYEHRMSLTIFESLWFSCNGLVTNLLQSFNNNFIRIESFNQRVYVTSWNSGNMLTSNDNSRNSSGLYVCTFPVSQWNLKKYHDWKDMQVV